MIYCIVYHFKIEHELACYLITQYNLVEKIHDCVIHKIMAHIEDIFTVNNNCTASKDEHFSRLITVMVRPDYN